MRFVLGGLWVDPVGRNIMQGAVITVWQSLGPDCQPRPRTQRISPPNLSLIPGLSHIWPVYAIPTCTTYSLSL